MSSFWDAPIVLTSSQMVSAIELSDEPFENHDRDDAGGDEDDLAQRVAVDLAAMQIGNEIGHRDVEQARGRKRQDERPDGGHEVDGAVGGQGAENAGSAGHDVQDQCVAAAVSGGQENRDVADL